MIRKYIYHLQESEISCQKGLPAPGLFCLILLFTSSYWQSWCYSLDVTWTSWENSISIILQCLSLSGFSFSRQPVVQAAIMEHLRSTLWKSVSKIRSSKWLFTWRYLFMRVDGSQAEGLSVIPTQGSDPGRSYSGLVSFPGLCPPAQGCPLLLPELQGSRVGPFLPPPILLGGSTALVHINWPSLALCLLQSWWDFSVLLKYLIMGLSVKCGLHCNPLLLT